MFLQRITAHPSLVKEENSLLLCSVEFVQLASGLGACRFHHRLQCQRQFFFLTLFSLRTCDHKDCFHTSPFVATLPCPDHGHVVRRGCGEDCSTSHQENSWAWSFARFALGNCGFTLVLRAARGSR